MAPLEIRLTYKANTPSGFETVTYGNVSNVCGAIHDLLSKKIVPKVEFIFADGEVREVPASVMV